MSILTFNPDGGGGYDILAPNGKNVGRLHRFGDGSLYFLPNHGSNGGWSAWLMREIADKLDELNKPWEDHINETLKP